VNEEAAVPVIPEVAVVQDAAVLLAILTDELRSYQTRKGQLMVDGPKGPKHESAGYTNPLQWWKKNSADLPHLSVLARKYLCIPATSAPSERVFSAAGLTIAKTRASLHPENAADLIFLHNSWEYAEKFNAKRKAEEALQERLNNNQPIIID
jgi:hAT family C-terminal dimerisation region